MIATDGTVDEPYVFGRKPSTRWPFPFSTREFARLLIVKAQFNRGEHDSAALWTQDEVLHALAA